MAVVAKFRVGSVESFSDHNAKVNMSAVYAPPGSDERVTSKEDGSFWDATPSGTLTMQVNNPQAAEQFQPGDEFYLSFEKADVG